MSHILEANGLAHLSDALSVISLSDWNAMLADKSSLLKHLGLVGIDKLGERQKVVNAMCKAQLEGVLPAPSSVAIQQLITRPAASGDGWTEIFVDDNDAAACTADESVAASHSLLIFSAVASAAECALLRANAGGNASCLHQQSGTSCDFPISRALLLARQAASVDKDGLRSDGQAGRIRGPVSELLDQDAQTLCDAILHRTMAQVEACLPRLTPRLFGRICFADRSILQHSGLVFTPGEPAINIYAAGGHFDPHTDKQSLTILVPLSHASSSGGLAAVQEGVFDGDRKSVV